MAQKTDLIRLQIAQTKSDLSENIATLERQVWGTVKSATHTVEETIDTIKNGVDSLNPSVQVQRHPLLAVGSAVVLGTLAGTLLAGRREPSRGYYAASEAPPAAPRATAAPRPRGAGLLAPFSEELRTIRLFALGALVQGVADAAKRAMPKYETAVDQIYRSLSKKIESIQPRSGTA